MKKSINIICVMIICVVIASVIIPTYQFGYYFGAGFNAGWESVEEGTTDNSVLQKNTPLTISFAPNIDKYTNAPDTIIDISNGNVLPFTVTQGSLFIPDNNIHQWYTIINTICELAIILLAIIILIKFIKFIVNINKDKIFEDRNIKLLRHLGLLLLCLAMSQITSGICSEIIINNLPYDFTGYKYSAYWQLPWGNMMLGLTSLLMAQIWARGIQMKKEQELTI